VSGASATVLAQRVATPVLERLGRRPLRATVVARAGSAVHAELDGFVVSITGAGAALMPNGIAVGGSVADAVAERPGERIWIAHGHVRGPLGSVRWDPGSPPEWEPRIAPWRPSAQLDLEYRIRLIGRHVDRADERDPSPPAWATARPGAVSALLGAVADRRPASALAAARALAGHGPGLTPVGDDLLAAAAATVATLGEAAGFGTLARRNWLRALAPPDLRRRTTSLSATLIDLALDGRALEPLHALLDQRPAPARRLESVVARLHGLGASSGRAYAFGAASCARRLLPRDRQTPEKEPA
jgi:hypothetical protein